MATNPPTSNVSLGDLLTAAKNIVTAVAAAAKTYQTVAGSANMAAISANTVVKASPGRLCVVTVTTAGSAVGHVYDSSTAATGRPVFVIPTTVGVYQVFMPMQYGIYAAPGSGQVFTVGYS